MVITDITAYDYSYVHLLMHMNKSFSAVNPCIPGAWDTLHLNIFLAVLGLRYCTWAFCSWGEWGLLSSCGAWASTAAASLVAEHQLQV